MGKKIRMNAKDYAELSESRAWCQRNGYTGFASWYDEHLMVEAHRHALPYDAPEARTLAESERDKRDGGRGGRY